MNKVQNTTGNCMYIILKYKICKYYEFSHTLEPFKRP